MDPDSRTGARLLFCVGQATELMCKDMTTEGRVASQDFQILDGLRQEDHWVQEFKNSLESIGRIYLKKKGSSIGSVGEGICCLARQLNLVPRTHAVEGKPAHDCHPLTATHTR